MNSLWSRPGDHRVSRKWLFHGPGNMKKVKTQGCPRLGRREVTKLGSLSGRLIVIRDEVTRYEEATDPSSLSYGVTGDTEGCGNAAVGEASDAGEDIAERTQLRSDHTGGTRQERLTRFTWRRHISAQTTVRLSKSIGLL